jgi:hypothetical protein
MKNDPDDATPLSNSTQSTPPLLKDESPVCVTPFTLTLNVELPTT